MAEDEDAQAATDPRMDFFEDYTRRTLRLKADKWAKFSGQDENRAALMDFCEKAEIRQLILSLNSSSQLQAGTAFPSQSKTKAVYFIKRGKVVLTKANIKTDILYGDLSYSPLDHLSVLVSDVLVPLLSNTKNHDGWPEVVTQDVKRHVHDLKNSVNVLNGQMRGRTLLPMPIGTERIEEAVDVIESGQQIHLHSGAFINNVETILIQWTGLVYDELMRDSGSSLKDDPNTSPQVEIEFWRSRTANLEGIWEQLNSYKVLRMKDMLEIAQSAYYPSFHQMYVDVEKALEEAEEINLTLRPMNKLLGSMEEADFPETMATIPAVMHMLALIWANCAYYRKPARMVILLQEIANQVLNQCRTHIGGDEIIRAEADEAVEKILESIKVCESVEVAYKHVQDNIGDFFKENPDDLLPWDFQTEKVFERLTKFIERLDTMVGMFRTMLEFLKLEKMEVSGLSGNIHSSMIQAIFTEFNDTVTELQQKPYDALDPDSDIYLQENKKFRNRVQDWDTRLATIVCQNFDECSSPDSIYKLIEMFGTFLDRTIIHEAFVEKYPDLIMMINIELDVTKRIYDQHENAVRAEAESVSNGGDDKSQPLKMSLVETDMPPVAGRLKWAQELKRRFQPPVLRMFKIKEEKVLETQTAQLVQTKYKEMMELLNLHDERLFDDWAKDVSDISTANLENPLLLRNAASKLLSVNFNPQLVAVLREVKYLNMRLDVDDESQTIPDIAQGIYAKNEVYRRYLRNLDLIVQWYNKVRETVLDVEFPLIEKQLQSVDNQLERALTSLCWTSEDAWEYIENTREAVHKLERDLQATKDNVDKITVLLTKWSVSPLFERHEGKNNTLIILEDRENRLNARSDLITKDSAAIHDLIKKNLELFNASEDCAEWRRYLQYVDDLIVDGFFNSIDKSISFFLEHTSSEGLSDGASRTPLFEAKMELIQPSIVFTPELEANSQQTSASGSFFDLVDGLVQDMFKQCSLFARIAPHLENSSYQSDVEDILELSDKRNELMERVNIASQAGCEYRDTFEKYHYLWKDDRSDFLSTFLQYGRIPTQEEIDQAGDEGLPAQKPTLNQFKEQVDKYESLYTEVSKEMPSTKSLENGWFRIDTSPFRAALLNNIKHWSFLFKQHLVDHVTCSLNDLRDFMQVTNAGLGEEVLEGNYDALVDCMAHLGAVRRRIPDTDSMFEPLKHTIDLLKTYQQEMSEDVHQLLEELPEQWSNTKKIASTVKQNVAPLQANEVNLLRRRSATFDVKQHEFREHFRSSAPLRFTDEEPYDRLDLWNSKIDEMETEMTEICNAAGLFEVNLPDFRQLKSCRREVGLLKTLWDRVFLVQTSFADWTKTLWREVNVEQLDMDSKKFAKDIRGLDKEMRAWDVFSGLDGRVKNMVTSLRAVGELQNPAIRERHWQQLMQATKVKFVMSDETNLDDLLKLNLHNFEDEVRGIVDKATKELNMEKIIGEMEVTWAQMEFEHEKHPRTGLPMLKSSEELIETLEENQVQLQNLMVSKYIAFFQEEVSGWQKKLSTSDQVITIWFEVQRTWSHLESIFIGSEDIRRQLPEQSQLFDDIDTNFKKLMTEAEKTPNVVAACCKEGLYQQLDKMETQLGQCQKALDQYLEKKRLVFPRFYFISSTDLLDILSKGDQPLEVARHLAKLFDSMSKLKFEEIDGKPTNKALGMYSKDGEYVDLSEECECVGQVEVWLNRLKECMVATIRHEFTEAVSAYEEKPREAYLMDFPAQVALTGTQVWWVVEVGIAFARIEEGYENALKEYNKKQIAQLNTLIQMLVGQLSKGDRQKIMTVCTIDVHSRDVVARLVQQKIDNAQAFLWLSQLRHRWDEASNHCFVNICDAQFKYSYEYLGNTPRLVITPLTDRCYITLTQSLHLTMSGAPAGPAGTGKTETTKDLGRALGIMVYVFNCSEQMDYKSVGNIYKGLSQTGAWGCFDEFNRISVEVLSVVAVQVKTIQDAIRDKKTIFNFLGEEIKMIPTVGIFITMNPGYAGRTELPENLKALFRPCAMVVPDFELICEIMLVAEGFMNARLLARKFITLYTLCRELLSKQDHYDWGLRAIKSVLVVAGSLKRGDPGRPEDQVLMRALRDFNLPKIVTDDVPIIMGLIGDLFPALNVPRKRDMDFEAVVKTSVQALGLQAEDSFVLKVVQMEELLAVRHSVFVIGGPGTGKTQVLKSLNMSYKSQKRKPILYDMNPKAVTANELFGFINPSTREWKDGLFSTTMRDLSDIANDSPKWIVLDGDIDPMWIESLNTVMDDNKVLTLASNERIPLNNSMRLVFEIGHLKYATPATVSRAGILFVNPQDLGWNPYVQSWIDRREVQSEKANLIILFERYIPPILDCIRVRFKKITPITETSMIQMLCYLLEVLLTPENTPPECPKEWYEIYFVFAAIWAFGAATFQDQLVDYRVEFSKWWVNDFKTIKFPSAGTVFDYYLDNETKKFLPWTERVPQFEFDPEMPLQAVMVHTAETTRIRYFIDLLMAKSRPVMLVGNAGTGKTVLAGDKFASMDEDYLVTTIPFNNYTTSAMLQAVMEKPLEKKAGRNYGPPGTKKLIYFIDDMNMPEVDTYGTVQPHTLLRQHLDYQHWYDRVKLQLREVSNVQYVSCMNPTAGSFTINPRLLRHFCVFAVSFPGMGALQHIYQSILSGYLATANFSSHITKMSEKLVTAALSLHQKVASSFLPTAVKFHYIFNLRDLSNIFQGILFASPECLKQPLDMVRLWLHEGSRVYGDKLVDDRDMEAFSKLKFDFARKYFEEMDEEGLKAEPLVFCHFASGIGEPKYLSVPSWNSLTRILEEALEGYNEVNAVMNLVLFEDALLHVCRINRILESPRGNALLVGVGGSGKQSLTRLAASVSGLEVFQITLRKGYALTDLKADLAGLFHKAGVKNIGIVFLLTDAQVPEEHFLVIVNDLLASGEVNDLFADDEVENIIGALRNEVKGSGMQDTRENCWKFFIDRVRRQLKVVLCFSPVGNVLRVRARMFPALVNCTVIDWFHSWPETALVSVSQRFIADVDLIPNEVKSSVSKFMAYAHSSVQELSKEYLSSERRYYYTTPKSFLEQIKLYQNLLGKKSQGLNNDIDRLENGLEKLKSTAAQVDDLKAKLASQEVELKQKNEDADKLIKIVGEETEKVSKEKAIADDEEKKVAKINREVSVKQRDCEEDLAKAEPALQAAVAALDTLNKNNLTELKSFGQPPPIVVEVSSAVMVLMAKPNKIPKDRSWKAAKIMMAKVDQFLSDLIHFDKENIHESNLKAIDPYLANKDFNDTFVRGKSFAAAGLCAWAVNIVSFYRVFCDVEPKRKALAAANQQLTEAQDKLAKIKKKIKQLDDNLAELTSKFEEATAAKVKCQQEADATNLTISLANRLVGGLASEKVRWGETVAKFREQEKMLPGDVLLTAAYLSYAGCFSKRYRTIMLHEKWMPFFASLQPSIPITEGLDPMTLLTDDATIAIWNNEGLPSDRMSTENATILTSAERWPLMIDPQLQGIKWIKTREEDLKVVRLGQKSYLDTIENAVSNGDCVLIENLGESVDPVLDPLLGRNTIKKGRYIKIGDKEVEFNPKFRLILHTKLANPHYKPEMQAQTSLINFTVTIDGLEDQLLANVVRLERPDLEELKADLTRQQNDFKIRLKELEDSLLSRLTTAGGNFLGDTSLVENLETTKKTAAEIAEKVKEAKITEQKINEAREHYRPAAARAALLYFILNDLNKINPMYQFSLKAFNVVFEKAVERAEKNDEVKVRVANLIDTVTFSVFNYTARGLFERDKLIFTSQVCFQILMKKKEIKPDELDFLLRFPAVPNSVSPVDFLSNLSWGGIKALSGMDEFRNLDRDIEGSAKRWKKFVDSECPELEKFPQEWKNKSSLQKMCMMRALRPDRMTYTCQMFIEEKLGRKYVESRSMEFSKSYEETGPATPVFFILSAGVNPVKDVQILGEKMGFTPDAGKYHHISLGQGQEVVADGALKNGAEQGHWVILENIHLVKKWLPSLEKQLESLGESGHESFRVYISAEPAGEPSAHIIPQGILETSIKITNEPPTGMKLNLHKSLDNFNQDTLEMCARENEFKSILFSLCYFHAVVAERRKFGPQGWNRVYPYNTGDLTISVDVLYNYLEANSKVPWEDLRYLFGEIMYGGHITDDWDRRLCRTYLEEWMKPELLDGDINFAIGFPSPPPGDYVSYHQYIDEVLPPESPYLYGLHPNAEIGFLTTTSEVLFRTVLEMQPRGSGDGEGSGATREEKVKSILDEIVEKLPDPFNVPELMARAEEKTPYVVVSFQECERMNMLTNEVRRSLRELDLGLKGELTITADMENLSNSLYLDSVPDSWSKRAYPSMLPLGLWYTDLLLRIKELENWVSDFNLPSCVWLSGFFNPQSFLTAIMQSMARKNEWPLDRMCLQCDVTKKNKEDIGAAPREGSYLHGLYMEGARWDTQTGLIQEARLKELTPTVPVMFVKAIPVDKIDLKNTYACPMYKTRQRGPTFVWTLNLKTKEKPARWILAGVALLLSV
ncbi:dynein beta chain, ciliary-like [Sycon ciliatum]|uniref:dynein beta chain, ciliary-like n=1 Tax=Sycon ciliatum TaxID=27933 RepID=UPI0031F709A4